MSKYCIDENGACPFFVMTIESYMCYRDRPVVHYLEETSVQDKATIVALENCPHSKEIPE